MLTGHKLDAEYIEDMVDDHENDVTELEGASIATKDPALRAWAAKAVPILEDHLEHARKLRAKTKR